MAFRPRTEQMLSAACQPVTDCATRKRRAEEPHTISPVSAAKRCAVACGDGSRIVGATTFVSHAQAVFVEQCDDLLLHTVRYLHLAEVARVARVSRAWRASVSSGSALDLLFATPEGANGSAPAPQRRWLTPQVLESPLLRHLSAFRDTQTHFTPALLRRLTASAPFLTSLDIAVDCESEWDLDAFAGLPPCVRKLHVFMVRPACEEARAGDLTGRALRALLVCPTATRASFDSMTDVEACGGGGDASAPETPGLREFGLDGLGLDAVDLSPLAQLTAVTHLSLQVRALRDEQLRQCLAWMPQLRSFDPIGRATAQQWHALLGAAPDQVPALEAVRLSAQELDTERMRALLRVRELSALQPAGFTPRALGMVSQFRHLRQLSVKVTADYDDPLCRQEADGDRYVSELVFQPLLESFAAARETESPCAASTLRAVHVHQVRFRRQDLAALLEAMPFVTTVTLFNCSVPNRLASVWRTAPNLRSIKLARCEVRRASRSSTAPAAAGPPSVPTTCVWRRR